MALSRKRKRLILILILGLLIAIISLRACSKMAPEHQKSLYKIARDKTWYPLNLLGKDRSMTAFTNELLFALSKEQKLQIQLLNIGYENLLTVLHNEDVDGILTPMSPTTAQNLLFSDSFYYLGPALIVVASSPVTSLKEMQGKSIGVLSNASLSYLNAHYPTVLITSYDNPLVALNDLENNVIDGVVLNALSAYTYAKGLYAGRLKVLDSSLTSEGLRLVTRKDPDSQYLIEGFNSGLKKLKANGTYDTLLKKWGLHLEG